MRIRLCLRKVKDRGFLWGQFYFDPNKRRYAGYRALAMGLHRFKHDLRNLSDGAFYLRKFPIFKHLHRINVAAALLEIRTSRVPGAQPWAWALLHKLKSRTYVGLRIRLGLPSRGQRTHTNARTVRRVSDAAAQCLRNLYLTYPVWLIRRIPVAKKPGVHSGGGISRRSLKVQRSRRGVIRTKDLKKKTQWN